MASSDVSIFVSYAHEDLELARALAVALRRRRCKVWIDDGEMRVGDSLIERIATGISEVHFVVALVSEASVESRWCRKELSLAITGGLGREGVKVLPLRVGDVQMPPALADVLWLPLDPSSVSEAAGRIKRDAESHLADSAPQRPASAPKARQVAPTTTPKSDLGSKPSDVNLPDFEPLKILGIVKEGVGRPRNDGMPGSALYEIPLRLSRSAPPGWDQLFVRNWDHPPSWSTMHRPGICRVYGNRVILDGTTMSELEEVHRRTLKLALDETNRQYAELVRKQFEKQEREGALAEQHRREIDEIGDRLMFGDEDDA